MRLATFVKNKIGTSISEMLQEVEEKVSKAPKKESDKEPSIPFREEKIERTVPPPASTLPVDTKVIEKEIREELVREFQQKTQQIELETKSLIQSLMEEQDRRLRDREKMLQGQWQKIQKEAQDLNESRDDLFENLRKSIAGEISGHFSALRQELQQEMQRQEEIAKTRQIIADLKDKFRVEPTAPVQEGLITEEKVVPARIEDQPTTPVLPPTSVPGEKKPEDKTEVSPPIEEKKVPEEKPDQVVVPQSKEPAEPPQEIREIIEEKGTEEAVARDQKIEEQKPSLDQEDEQKKIEDKEIASQKPLEESKPIIPPAQKEETPKRREVPVMPVESAASLKEKEARTTKQAEGVFAVDPELRARVNKDYMEMVSGVSRVFSQVAKGQEIGAYIKGVEGCVERMVSGYESIATEIIHVTLQPYPTSEYFAYHAVNTALLAGIIGLDLEFTETEMKDLCLAALLHDIGLVNVGEDLNYPSLLTPDLQKEVRNHPVRGEELLRPYVNDRVLMAVRQHHEVCNGQGYPDGILGQDIDFNAKVIHVVDAFEALTHERPYRQHPLDVSEAIKEIIEMGRSVYDAVVLKALMERIGLYPVMSLVELSNKQIARVVRQNRGYPLSPVVNIEFDERGKKLLKPVLLDLSQSRVMHIMKTVGDATSSFHAARLAEEKAGKKDQMKFFKDVIPFLVIATAIALLFYIIIKI
ncbi:MAG: HD domain-containing protein [Candidatus Omnitrophica bacterium]|nr:HD domain-containing protein [Candidatus Omnitrophota bacterium]